MHKIKLNINKLGDSQLNIKIPLGHNFIPVDTSEIAENQFVDDEIASAINPTQDYEKMRFKPFSGVTEVIVQLMDSGSIQKTYDYYEYTNDDLKFRRNRFKNSFIKLNFYDTPLVTKQSLAFQMIIYNQLNEDQRDISGNLLDIASMPITYRLVDPITVRNGVSEGYYIYWLKNPEELYPNNFYMYATYNNAKDGVSSPLIAYDNSIAINTYNDYNYNKYILRSSGNMQEYAIDVTDRTISVVNNQLIIKLYKPNIV